MFSRLAPLALSVILASAISSVRAGDPGDLFPEVSYDKAVRSPIREPEKTVTPPVVRPPVVKPVATAPAVVTIAPKIDTPVAQTKPAVPTTIAAAKTPTPHLWAPYTVDLSRPFLSETEQAEFDKTYSPTIKAALAGTFTERQKAMDALTEASNTVSPSLKRYLLLHVVALAIKNNTALADRSARALRVVPLLTDDSLAVAQAKADCLSNLATSSPENATDKLWGMLAESQALLAKYQVQTAFPKVAVDTLRKSRDSFARMKDRSACHSELITEAQAWVDYALTANQSLPSLRTALRSDAADAGANTQIAMLYLVLYADLAEARGNAQNAKRPDLAAFAKTLTRTGFPALATDDAGFATESLDFAASILEIAKASPLQLERYALACLVVDRLEDLKAANVAAESSERLTPLLATAEKLAEDNAYKPLVPPKTAEIKPTNVTNNPNVNNNTNQPKNLSRFRAAFRKGKR